MSDGDGELWHVAENGKRHGPYTADMVQERLNQGRFSKSAIVWKSGFSSWQPIDLHFTKALNALQLNSVEQPVEPKKPVQRPEFLYVRWFLVSTTVALFVLIYSRSVPVLTNELSPPLFIAVYLCVFGGLGLSGAACAFLWWRHPPVFLASDRKRGLFRVAVAAGASVVALAVFIGLSLTSLAYRAQIARAASGHYSVNVDIPSQTLTIKGLIGPGLASEVSKQLRSNAAIKTVAINSAGGLIDEAMKIALEIKHHGGLTTKVVDECNSACIHIFMSGKRRVADRTFIFGFHAGSSITPLSGAPILERLLTDQVSEADKYLVLQGVPEAFLSSANALGPDELFMVPADKMASAGAVTELLDTDDLASDEKLKVQIEQFSKQAGHERFEELRPRMITLLQTGQAETLQEAYNKALALAR